MTSPGVIEYREIPEPGSLNDHEILLRIKKIGVCGSDIHVFQGKHPATPYPVVQGHEYSAIIEAVGKKVTNVKPGMKATARPQLVCGTCGPCKRGQYNACQELKVQGFQVGFEAAGVQSSLDVLMQFVEKGGDVVILGVYSQNPVVNMFFLGEHELNVFGSMMYRQEDYETAAEMIASGKIITAPLRTKSFPFAKYLEAYKFIEHQGDKTMKVMIDL